MQAQFQVITSLVPGGAERLVVNLLQYCDRQKYYPVCICLGHPVESHYEDIVRTLKIPLYFLGKGDKADWGVYKKLERLFAEYRPTVVHTHLLGLNYAYLAMMKYRTPVRVHTLHSLAQKELGNRVARIVRMLAFRHRIGGVVPVAIADEVARTIEQLYGYRNPPVIPNGIPVDEYASNPEKRAQFRAAHGVESDAIVIVHIGAVCGAEKPRAAATRVCPVAQQAAALPMAGGRWRAAPRDGAANAWVGACRARALLGDPFGCGGYFERCGYFRTSLPV